MCKKFRFHTHTFKKSPYRGRGETPLPPLGRFAPSLWPPLTNPGCTTVTAIAKMHKAPCSPLIGVKENFEKGGYMRDLYTCHLTLLPPPLIMSFNVEENAVFIHEFSKNLPTVGGGHPLPLPPLGRFAPSLCLPPVEKSWLRHCPWHQMCLVQGNVKFYFP